MTPLPLMEPYRRHVLVCTGGFCAPDRRGRELYALLARLLQREGLLFGPDRVKRGETPCLGVCAGGPIVVVYPEGVWYAGVTPALLDGRWMVRISIGAELTEREHVAQLWQLMRDALDS